MVESLALCTSSSGILNKMHHFHSIQHKTCDEHVNIFSISRQDDVKLGTLVGEDKYGNKYYENNMYFYG